MKNLLFSLKNFTVCRKRVGREKHRAKLFPTVMPCFLTLQNLSSDTDSAQTRDHWANNPLTLQPSCMFLARS